MCPTELLLFPQLMVLYVLEMGLCVKEDALWAHGLYLEPFSLCHLKVMYLGQETIAQPGGVCGYTSQRGRYVCIIHRCVARLTEHPQFCKEHF